MYLIFGQLKLRRPSRINTKLYLYCIDTLDLLFLFDSDENRKKAKISDVLNTFWWFLCGWKSGKWETEAL